LLERPPRVAAQPANKEAEDQKRKKCMDYFKIELGWDISAGVKPEDIESVLEGMHV